MASVVEAYHFLQMLRLRAQRGELDAEPAARSTAPSRARTRP